MRALLSVFALVAGIIGGAGGMYWHVSKPNSPVFKAGFAAGQVSAEVRQAYSNIRAEAEAHRREAAAKDAALQQSQRAFSDSEARLKAAEDRAENYAKYLKGAQKIVSAGCPVDAEWLRRDAKTTGAPQPAPLPPSRPRPGSKAGHQGRR